MSLADTFRAILFHSRLNVLLIAVPFAMVAYLVKAHPLLTFILNAIAIIPLSGLLSYATESIASDMGDAVGALMNISFGNVVEVAIFMAALSNNQIRIVQASLLGSILVNLLLILGTAIIAGSLKHREQSYDLASAQAMAGLLCVSVFSLMIPVRAASVSIMPPLTPD